MSSPALPVRDQYSTRTLQKGDLTNGYLQLLGQLTVTGAERPEQLEERFKEIQRLQPHYHIVVIEDVLDQQLLSRVCADRDSSRVVATGTLLVELKFHRCCGCVGHIEDVVVDAAHRGAGLGLRIVNELVKAARAAGCYKVILDCSNDNVDFYAKSGFERKEVHMAQYFQR